MTDTLQGMLSQDVAQGMADPIDQKQNNTNSPFLPIMGLAAGGMASTQPYQPVMQHGANVPSFIAPPHPMSPPPHPMSPPPQMNQQASMPHIGLGGAPINFNQPPQIPSSVMQAPNQVLPGNVQVGANQFPGNSILAQTAQQMSPQQIPPGALLNRPQQISRGALLNRPQQNNSGPSQMPSNFNPGNIPPRGLVPPPNPTIAANNYIQSKIKGWLQPSEDTMPITNSTNPFDNEHVQNAISKYNNSSKQLDSILNELNTTYKGLNGALGNQSAFYINQAGDDAKALKEQYFGSESNLPSAQSVHKAPNQPLQGGLEQTQQGNYGYPNLQMPEQTPQPMGIIPGLRNQLNNNQEKINAIEGFLNNPTAAIQEESQSFDRGQSLNTSFKNDYYNRMRNSMPGAGGGFSNLIKAGIDQIPGLGKLTKGTYDVGLSQQEKHVLSQNYQIMAQNAHDDLLKLRQENASLITQLSESTKEYFIQKETIYKTLQANLSHMSSTMPDGIKYGTLLPLFNALGDNLNKLSNHTNNIATIANNFTNNNNVRLGHQLTYQAKMNEIIANAPLNKAKANLDTSMGQYLDAQTQFRPDLDRSKILANNANSDLAVNKGAFYNAKTGALEAKNNLMKSIAPLEVLGQSFKTASQGLQLWNNMTNNNSNQQQNKNNININNTPQPQQITPAQQAVNTLINNNNNVGTSIDTLANTNNMLLQNLAKVNGNPELTKTLTKSYKDTFDSISKNASLLYQESNTQYLMLKELPEIKNNISKSVALDNGMIALKNAIEQIDFMNLNTPEIRNNQINNNRNIQMIMESQGR